MCALAVAGLAAPSLALADDGSPLIIFAAASLKTALDEVGASWQRETGQVVRLSYAGTSSLARQIEQGAPADLFISADLDWMAYLADRKLVGESAALLGNRLVLVAPRDSGVALRLSPSAPLAAALDGGRLAVANVQSVPAGRYAKAALESLGLWASVADRLVQTGNVRAALRLVARGETPLGIVRRSASSMRRTREPSRWYASWMCSTNRCTRRSATSQPRSADRAARRRRPS